MKTADRYIDLHLHLDGAITVDIARKLAEMQGITLPGESDAELEKYLSVPEDCRDLNDLLRCFALPLTLLQTPEGLSFAVRLVAEASRADGVIYAEIRFAPQLHGEKGMSQEEAIRAALRGLENTGLHTNLILCCMRGIGNEPANEETLHLTKKFLTRDGGVVALDLAGAEALYPTSDYRELFGRAKEMGIPFTLHAGEAAGPESVRLAVSYGASRIGHGVRITEDPTVMKLIRENGIPLELCPTSNRITRAVEDMSKYPLRAFLAEGIRATLNTDDPAIERTTLSREFRYMEKEVGLTPEDEALFLRNSVDAAFTSEDVKHRLINEIHPE